MSLVLDASVAVTWLFAAERNPASQAVLDMVVTDGALVPSLWRLEIANVLLNAVRKGRSTQAHADQSILELSKLPLTIDDQTDLQAWDATLALAIAYRLTTYDAAYLELAVRTIRPLATRDRALVRAALNEGVQTLGL